MALPEDVRSELLTSYGQARWRDTIAIWSGPLKCGGLRKFGASAPMKA